MRYIMASSSFDDAFIYPDPSLLGQLPPEQLLAARASALAAPVVASPPQFTAPATISPAPALPLAPVDGPVPASPPSAAGLQRFPKLVPGLRPPVELTDGASIAKWNHNLRRNDP